MIEYGLAGLQLASGYFAAENIKKTAKLNQDIANMNAEFAELDAYDAKIEGESQVAKYQSVIDNALGEQQARLAAADVDLNYGSVADIQKETRFIGELNKMEIIKQAEQQALGYKRQARDYKLGGVMNYSQAKSQASTVQTQAILGAALTGYKGYSKG